MYKILVVTVLAACSQAQHYDHQATSYIKLNDHHNSVHHIHSAPALLKAAPVHYAAPSHGYAASAQGYAAPAHHAQSYSSAPAHYAAPVLKVAVPIAAPAHHGGAGSYSSFSSHSSALHGAPVAHYAAPVAKVVAPVAVAHAPAHHGYQHHEEAYAPAKYEFAYGVEDHHTGDIHSHKEVRDGDVTHGEYSLHEADGTIRTVKYTVDKHSGFNAVVERSGHAQHAQPAQHKIVAPLKAVVAAPHHYHH